MITNNAGCHPTNLRLEAYSLISTVHGRVLKFNLSLTAIA